MLTIAVEVDHDDNFFLAIEVCTVGCNGLDNPFIFATVVLFFFFFFLPSMVAVVAAKDTPTSVKGAL